MTFAALPADAASENTSVPAPLAAPAKQDAVLILAVSRGVNATYVFRPVNLATGAFTTSPTTRLVADIFGFGDEMKGGYSPDDGPSKVSFFGNGIELLMENIPAGDYAVAEVAFGNLDACLNDSAVVVRVPPHSITMVSSGDVAPPGVFSRLATNTDAARLFKAFDSARTNYPELQGEPVNAEIVTRIRWPRPSGFFLGDRCHASDQFSTIQAITADTSAARAAALEEAQKNLAKAKSGTTAMDGSEKNSSPTTIGNKQ